MYCRDWCRHKANYPQRLAQSRSVAGRLRSIGNNGFFEKFMTEVVKQIGERGHKVPAVCRAWDHSASPVPVDHVPLRAWGQRHQSD